MWGGPVPCTRQGFVTGGHGRGGPCPVLPRARSRPVPSRSPAGCPPAPRCSPVPSPGSETSQPLSPRSPRTHTQPRAEGRGGAGRGWGRGFPAAGIAGLLGVGAVSALPVSRSHRLPGMEAPGAAQAELPAPPSLALVDPHLPRGRQSATGEIRRAGKTAAGTGARGSRWSSCPLVLLLGDGGALDWLPGGGRVQLLVFTAQARKVPALSWCRS